MLGYTQSQMAEKLEIPQKDVSRMESGKVKFIPNQYIRFLYEEKFDLNWVFYEDNARLHIRLDDENTPPNIAGKPLSEYNYRQDSEKEIETLRARIKEQEIELKALYRAFRELGKGE